MGNPLNNLRHTPYRVCYFCNERYYSVAEKNLLLCDKCQPLPMAQALIIGVKVWAKNSPPKLPW